MSRQVDAEIGQEAPFFFAASPEISSVPQFSGPEMRLDVTIQSEKMKPHAPVQLNT